MPVLDSIRGALDNYVRGRGKVRQGEPSRQAYSDRHMEAGSFSVEAMVCQTLASLVSVGLEYRCTGTSARATLMDSTGDRFVRRCAVPTLKLGLEFGDCICVPSLIDGRMEHAVIPLDDFRILACSGDEITEVCYIVQRKRMSGRDYALVQDMRLETAIGGTRSASMSLEVVTNDGAVIPVSEFPDWAGAYPEGWTIPNCEHLPIGRFKCFAQDADHPNGVYGVPVCHGASQFIREIHYLVEQEHAEFELSEKGVIADKTMFVKDGSDQLSMPRGRQRLFMKVNNGSRSLDAENHIDEWAPEIQLDPYSEAIEQQLQMIEKVVGVDRGIISSAYGSSGSSSYENVDNVRRSLRKTQAFVDSARDCMEECMTQLTYAWDVLYNVAGYPTGSYSVAYEWSDDYLNSYSDMRESLVAGYSMGATDAVDYRLFVMGESVEEARARVEEIQAGRTSSVVLADASYAVGAAESAE